MISAPQTFVRYTCQVRAEFEHEPVLVFAMFVGGTLGGRGMVAKSTSGSGNAVDPTIGAPTPTMDACARARRLTQPLVRVL